MTESLGSPSREAGSSDASMSSLQGQRAPGYARADLEGRLGMLDGRAKATLDVGRPVRKSSLVSDSLLIVMLYRGRYLLLLRGT